MVIHQTAPRAATLQPIFPDGKKRIPQDTDIMFAKTGHKLVRISLSQILYFKGSGNYVTICTKDKKILVHTTMRAIEELVDSFQFIRTHKSFIVALQHMVTVDSNSLTVGAKRIPVSESYRDKLMKFLSANAYVA